MNVSETNTLPWSITMVSGMMTGLAAASGQPLVDGDQPVDGAAPTGPSTARGPSPGRIGSGTSMRASSTAASTALVPCRAQHGRADRPGRDIQRDRQLRAAGYPVIQHRHHVQRRRVDLDDLPGPLRGGHRERRGGPVRVTAPPHRRPERVPAALQVFEHPVDASSGTEAAPAARDAGRPGSPAPAARPAPGCRSKRRPARPWPPRSPQRPARRPARTACPARVLR